MNCDFFVKDSTIDIFMLYPGNPVDKSDSLQGDLYLEGVCFNDGRVKRYAKRDIINAVTQMNSLMRAGIGIQHGIFAKRCSPGEIIKAGFKLRKETINSQVKVVHAMWGATTSLVTILFSAKPVVISLCGSDLLHSGNLNRYLSSLLSQISGIFADRIIVKSLQMYDCLWNINRKKCTIIPNGVDMEIFYPIDKNVARSKLSWSDTDFIILFFAGGKGSEIKDPKLAQAVVSYVQKKISNVKMIKVENVPHEFLNYYYNAADALLLTSIHEGSNNSLKEALCCNIPIVSVDCGDTKERLNGVDQCHIIDNRVPEAIGDKLIEVLEINKRSNGRDHIRSLSLENVARKIIEVYKKALKAGR
jgi:teichuronic acid biosynthesis glycosyltransferase TuaC